MPHASRLALSKIQPEQRAHPSVMLGQTIILARSG